eukprot:g13752.t1
MKLFFDCFLLFSIALVGSAQPSCKPGYGVTSFNNVRKKEFGKCVKCRSGYTSEELRYRNLRFRYCVAPIPKCKPGYKVNGDLREWDTAKKCTKCGKGSYSVVDSFYVGYLSRRITGRRCKYCDSYIKARTAYQDEEGQTECKQTKALLLHGPKEVCLADLKWKQVAAIQIENDADASILSDDIGDLEAEVQQLKAHKARGGQGVQGVAGPRGATGKNGQKGDQGIQGQKGKDGQKGDRGPQGQKGERGERGATGNNGQKGDRGAQGPRGNNGQKGERGPQGKEGDRGEKGARGNNGQKGDRGPQGPRGNNGQKGERGAQGPRGNNGQKGERGPRGPRGERGNDGMGLSLKTFKVGQTYHYGDYVFSKSSRDNHDSMFIAEKTFVAAKKPYLDLDSGNWVEFHAPHPGP